MKILTALVLVAVNSALAASKVESQASDISKAWKLDLAQINIDPSTWSVEFRERMTKVGAGVGYALTLSLPLTHLALFGLFLFGLVKLSWPIVMTSCLAVYGWSHNRKVFLATGLVATYALSFGLSIL